MKRLVIFAVVIFSIIIGMIVWENTRTEQTAPKPQAKVAKQEKKTSRSKHRVIKKKVIHKTVHKTVHKTKHKKHVSRSYKRKPGLDLRNRELWMLIHKCEGSWTDNSNFEGGLQFLHSTWVSAGGRAFAEHAYQATPEEQITVANWYSSGGSWLAPWPTCGRRAAKVLGLEVP